MRSSCNRSCRTAHGLHSIPKLSGKQTYFFSHTFPRDSKTIMSLFRMMIGMFDRDGSATIDFEEFASLWKYIDDWQKCFRSFDKDNSGSIDKNELKLALTTFGNYISHYFSSFFFLSLKLLWRIFVCQLRFEIEKSLSMMPKREARI